MSLAHEYERQLSWRDWERVLDALPPLSGRTVLDFGCSVGDVAAMLAERGARVIGVDLDDELLEAARAKGLPNAEFRRDDLRTFSDPGLAADGIFCGFTAAYFVDLPAVLSRWATHLAPGGWIALVEMDDLFGHEPVTAETRRLLDDYARDSFDAGRYDFHMGRKLEAHLERAGFGVAQSFTVADRELAFEGAATPDVIEAWRQRLQRMKLLRAHCGDRAEAVVDDLLNCFAHPDHRTRTRVFTCLATRPR